ncbi:MAG: transposase [Candidatus Thiodiazotropha sp. (ex Lucinoma aequizonata)]|nr:transposase [Candidatus Thiodiazotropha sp. (ex Lucinoma aequizonata)]
MAVSERGHRYLTLLYQIDEHNKRLLWIGEKRTVKTLLRFFRWFGKERSLELKFVCSDRWIPEGNCQEGWLGSAYSGSFSYHGASEQGD